MFIFSRFNSIILMFYFHFFEFVLAYFSIFFNWFPCSFSSRVLSRSFVKFLQALSILFQTFTFIFLALLLSTSLYLFPHSLMSDLTFFSFTHFLIITKFYINIFILVSSYPVISFHFMHGLWFALVCFILFCHLFILPSFICVFTKASTFFDKQKDFICGSLCRIMLYYLGKMHSVIFCAEDL